MSEAPGVTLQVPNGEQFDRIIVIVTRQIGDVLVTTPLIREARQRWPAAQIDVLGFKGTLGMLKGNPDVNDLIEVVPASSWKQSWPLIRRLWRRYDLALIAQYSDRAHLYGWMAARKRAGQVPAGRQSWWKRLLLVHEVELGAHHGHVVLEKLRLLTPWAERPAEVSVQAPPGAPLPAALARGLHDRYVVLQVPSLVAFKQWPLDHYVETVKGLAARGVQSVLTGGPSQADRDAVQEVVRRVHQESSDVTDSVIDAAGQLDFNQIATLLTGASLYIGPDTSVTHLAAASGLPTVALYGPIDPCLWGPWPQPWPTRQPFEADAEHDESGHAGRRKARRNVILLQGGQSCVPCNRAGCDNHMGSRSECLETLGPERVLAEAWRVLSAES